MSTTTQILFHSPALHSLKRDQLVKLCKIHSLKASGKKKELLERLQLHAKTLPPDDPLSIATRSDNPGAKSVVDSEDEASDRSREGSASINGTPPRPSEQWEVVMETIKEVDEETLRSNRGASDRQVGEFGTTTSKASVTSSLRAIATSLGFKRNTSKSNSTASSFSSQSSGEVVQSSSTLPTSDPGVEPVPGQSNLQGLPAPSAARLSLSQAPATTTIRLVSNPAANPELLLSPPKLKPFAISFDLVPATPGGAESTSVPVWPLSPGGAARGSLYPPVPDFRGFGDLHKQESPQFAQHDESDMDLDVDMPGGLVIPSIHEPTPQKANAGTRFNTGATPKSNEKPSADTVDIFSPAPKPQAVSTRSRLGVPRSAPFVFGSPLPQNNMSNLQFRTAAQSVLDEMNKRLAEEGIEAVDTDVLNHRQTTTESVEKKESNGPHRVADMFDKVHQKEFDKMDSIASHYAAKRGAQSTASQPILSKKRKSSLVVKERQPGVPTARHRPNGSRVASSASMKTLPGGFAEESEEDELGDRRMSKRPRVEREDSVTPAQPNRSSRAPSPNPEEEARKQKEREAIRRRLEHNKAKRRSSMGRPSLGRVPPPKPKPARSGFFASAKSLVQNVWNRGAGSRAPANVSKQDTKTLPRSTEAKKSTAVPGSSGAPQSKGTPSGGSSKSVQPGRSTLAAPVVFGGTGGTISKLPTAANPRSSTVAGYGRSGNKGTSLVGFSSLGRKTVLPANESRVSSAAARPDVGTSAAVANLQKHASGIPRARTSSTLLAPTASSLAKMNSNARIPVTMHNENSTLGRAMNSKQRSAMSPQPSATLEQITNSPRSPALPPSPVKIFSQPLSPSPVRPSMSLTTAAATIASQSAQEKPFSATKPTDPTKGKVLPGRRPRISRSKVIARLASQRAAGTSSSAAAGAQRPSAKVRSSMGAEAAGKSYGGTKGGDMMGAKKRIRQSEQARRKSRIAGDGQRMDVD